MNHASGKASNAVLAKARALYGRRLRAEDYRRLTDCHTMTELANELKALPLYANTLAEVNPTYARRAQLENLLRQSQYERFDSLCRYDRSAGSSVYQYLTLCCEVDELTAALRCLDAGRPAITCTACRTFWSSAAALICTRWPKPPICKAFWLRYRVRPGLRYWPRWPTLSRTAA